MTQKTLSKQNLTDTKKVDLSAAENVELSSLSKVPPHSSSTRLIQASHWNKYHDWPPIGGLRHLIFNEKINGFDKVIKRVGRRCLIDEKKFFELVKIGFASKRKMLLGNLKKTFPSKNLLQIFADCSIPGKTRAEDLPLKKWASLVKEIYK